MGGPRITESKRGEMRRMRMDGMSCADIANELSVSQNTVVKNVSDITIDDIAKDGELFADIEGTNGKNKISSHGRVFFVSREGKSFFQHKIKHGKKKLNTVFMCVNGRQKTFRVDRLVMETFTGHKLAKDEKVIHVNGDNSNDRLENLMVVDKSYDPVKEMNRKRPVLSDRDISRMQDMWLRGSKQQELAKKFGVSATTIFTHLKGLKRDSLIPESEDGEIWSEVAGYDGRYIVSSHGRIFSLGNGRMPQKFLSQSTDHDGYMKVRLTNPNGGGRVTSVHRIVAEAFCPGRTDERCVVNHKDGDITNNHADNLEWCTPAYNTRHAVKQLGVKMGGEEPFNKKSKRIVPPDPCSVPSPHRRFTDNEVLSIRSDSRSSRELAKLYGVNKCTIQNIRLGKTYKNI